MSIWNGFFGFGGVEVGVVRLSSSFSMVWKGMPCWKFSETAVSGVGGKIAVIGVGYMADKELGFFSTVRSPSSAALPSPLDAPRLARFDGPSCGE